MDSIISTFHIDWKIIIAQAINFGVVFAVLYIFALKPLAKLMEERSGKIAKGIDDAKTNATLLAKTEEEYNDALARAKAEANKIFQEGKKEADAKRIEMLENAKTEVAGVIENGRKVLEAEKVKIVEEAKKEIVDLALKATEKLLGEKMGDSFNDKTIKELNNL
ncbi:MAG: F0F1 ATP synthase subunit B [Candidatus Paceibacterota bacterium]|jgi:F-type H+-transporting ATPase subunit b